MIDKDSRRAHIQKFCDFLAAGLLGALFFLYSVYGADFAEICVRPPILNFPVFIGEISLGLLIFWLILRFLNLKMRLKPFHFLVIAFTCFILIKAGYGYFKWGSLALRHAALFYYPLYGVCSFQALDPKYSENRWLRTVFLAVLLAGFFLAWKGYYLLTYFLFALAVLSQFVSKKFKVIFFIILLAIFPYRKLFDISRAGMIANLTAMGFLVFSGLLVLNIRLRLKLLIALIISLVVVLGALKFADKNNIHSLLVWKVTLAEFKAANAKVAREKGTFKFAPISPWLYAKGNDNALEQFLETSGIKKTKPIPTPHIILSEKPGSLHKVKVEKKAGNKKVAWHVKIKSTLEPEQHVEENIPAKVAQTSSINPAPEPERSVQTKIPAKEVKTNSSSSSIIITPDVKGSAIKPVSSNNNISKKVNTRSGNSILKPMEYIPSLSQTSVQPVRDIQNAEGNINFRLITWKDMLEDLSGKKPVFGFDFGKPFRSKSLEILNWATGSWATHGWVEAHNSYLAMIYRAGIVGICLILLTLAVFFRVSAVFIKKKSFAGIMLCAVLAYWLTISNFLVILELPATAVPFWILFGLTLRVSGIFTDKDKTEPAR